MEKCKLCNKTGPFYAASRIGQWHFGVCKECCRKEYYRQKLFVEELRRNAPDKSFVCHKCGKAKTLRNYSDCQVASAVIDFPCTCRECHNEGARKNYKNRKFKALVADLA